MGRATRAAFAVLAAATLLSACGESARDPSAAPAVTRTPAGGDLATADSNELGLVPVLMYHHITADPEQPSDRTPAEFRAELGRLYDEGYRPVTAVDYVTGAIDLPAGVHPVVLTFDDATAGQAGIGPDGEPDPETALGILKNFGRTHADFDATATFFVLTSRTPFGDPAVLPWLAANGYEIGAHTRTHPDLGELGDARVQAEIGRNVAEIQAAVPGYRVRTFATPYGRWPDNPELARRGVSAGVPYEFDGVFTTGGENAYSPFADRFDRFAVPRLASGLSAAVDALAALRSEPGIRFTSDGDPDRISRGRPASS